jgi:hypothetical protein
MLPGKIANCHSCARLSPPSEQKPALSRAEGSRGNNVHLFSPAFHAGFFVAINHRFQGLRTLDK